MPNQKSFQEVLERFANIEFDETFDLVVAIANGGIVPAGIINQRLLVDFQILRINFKDENQQPRYNEPILMMPIDFEFKNKKILLVDDRIKSGSTIKLAKQLLKDAAVIKTFAVNGKADYSLFNEMCFRFPWNI